MACGTGLRGGAALLRAGLAAGVLSVALCPHLCSQAPAADYSTATEVVADFANGRLEGLEPLQAEQYYGYVEDELGGKRCIRTDSATGKHSLSFRAAPGFADTPDLPLTALVEYYDQPAGLLGIFCLAALGTGTDWAQAYRTVRKGEPQWVQVCVPLPHCRFGGEPTPWRQIGLTGFTTSGDARAADVAVASIRLLRAHMTVEPKLPAVPANGTDEDRTVTIIGTLRAADTTPPPDGTEVAFQVQPLELAGAATTVNGEAAWQFVPAPAPGRLLVTALWGDIRAETPVWVYPTDRPLIETEVPLADFEGGERLRLTPMAAAGTTALLDTETVREGASALRINFHWDQEATQQPGLRLDINRQLPGVPKEIAFEVYGDGVGNSLCFSVVDAQQESFAYIVGDMVHQGWETLICPLTEDRADDIWGERSNRQFDLPLTFQNIRLMKNDDPLEGTLYLDNVRAICLVPEGQQ